MFLFFSTSFKMVLTRKVVQTTCFIVLLTQLVKLILSKQTDNKQTKKLRKNTKQGRVFMYFVLKIMAFKGRSRDVCCLVVFRKSELSCCHTNISFLTFSYTTCKDQKLFSTPCHDKAVFISLNFVFFFFSPMSIKQYVCVGLQA